MPTSTKKRKASSADVAVDKDAGEKKKSTPAVSKMTMKDKIQAILDSTPKLIGLPTIKKLLMETYAIEDSKIFVSNVNKALKSLVETEAVGKVGGSYHGGKTSASFLQYQKDCEEAEAKRIEEAEHEGETQCPFCDKWCSEECFVKEDSVARGGEHFCDDCGSTFWTWISDDYKYGHEFEYKYSVPDYGCKLRHETGEKRTALSLK